jgi:hypothetical protein
MYCKKTPLLSIGRLLSSFLLTAALYASPTGDLDDNGRVDTGDLAVLVQAYGSTDPAYDLNGDGQANFQDALTLIERIPTGDFNGDSQADTDDLALLVKAYGSDDLIYDLSCDGQVDFQDALIFIDRFKPSPPPKETGTPDTSTDESAEEQVDLSTPAPKYLYWTSPNSLTFAFAEYIIIISKGSPFGIVSLRLLEQRTNFVPSRDPAVLADWEWFRIDVDGKQEWLKLITPGWDEPIIDLGDEIARVRFLRQDAITQGIILGVEYEFSTRRPEFDVRYFIVNDSGQTLQQPYVMLGFPGFPNFSSIVEVGTAFETRTPRAPFDNFRDEAVDVNLSEYPLLYHNALPGVLPEELKASIVVADGDRLFELETTYAPTNSYSSLRSAHTNKPDYLTSHLYATFFNIPQNRQQAITVHYALSER